MRSRPFSVHRYFISEGRRILFEPGGPRRYNPRRLG
jgi:hypothetical protein